MEGRERVLRFSPMLAQMASPQCLPSTWWGCQHEVPALACHPVRGVIFGLVHGPLEGWCQVGGSESPLP